MENINHLVYGKSEVQNIVSIEPLDNQTLLFIEKNGVITQEVVPNRYWILSHKPYPPLKWRKMTGNQYFQYGTQFDTREEFERTRSFLNKKYGKENIYSIYNKKEAFMVKDGFTYYKSLELKDVSILSFDIETTSLKFQNPANDKVLLISNTYRNQGKITKKLFSYDDYNSPKEMLQDWASWIREMNPSIICGHNIFGFDFLYLQSIANYYDFTLDLGRDGSPLFFDRYDSKFRKDQTSELFYRKCHIFGREIVDTYFLSIKYDVVAKKYDSYGLKPIIEKEGLVDPNRTFYDASQIRFNYKKPEEWKKIKEYCIDDSDDSLKLFDLMAPAYFYMTQSIPKSFQEIICSASGSQINSLLIRSYLQNGFSIPKASDIKDFQGAISFAVPGIYRNMLKIDFAGLYPSILRQFKIYDQIKDPNKHLTHLVEFFATQRLENKKKSKETKIQYYEDMQQMQKILCNSFYGFLSTRGLNFNSPENAAFITGKAREFLTTSIYWATGKTTEEWLNKSKEKE